MSRDTFYRYKAAVEEGGVEALFERTRRKPNLANRVGEATEQAVIKSALEFPAYGQARTSNELRKQGVFSMAGKGNLRCVRRFIHWVLLINFHHQVFASSSMSALYSSICSCGTRVSRSSRMIRNSRAMYSLRRAVRSSSMS